MLEAIHLATEESLLRVEVSAQRFDRVHHFPTDHCHLVNDQNVDVANFLQRNFPIFKIYLGCKRLIFETTGGSFVNVERQEEEPVESTSVDEKRRGDSSGSSHLNLQNEPVFEVYLHLSLGL